MNNEEYRLFEDVDGFSEELSLRIERDARRYDKMLSEEEEVRLS